MEHTCNTRAKRFSRRIPTQPERVLLPRAFSLKTLWPEQLTQQCRRRSLGSLNSREWAGWSRSSVAASCHLMIHCPHTLSHTLSLCLPAGWWVKSCSICCRVQRNGGFFLRMFLLIAQKILPQMAHHYCPYPSSTRHRWRDRLAD